MTTSTDIKRLYKSRTDRMIDGVCGGIAEYFGLDSTLVRIAWVLLTLLGGAGILVYIVAMIVMPTNPAFVAVSGNQNLPKQSSKSSHKFWGILFVVVGAFWLMGNLGFPFWYHWWGVSWSLLLPLLLILAGVAFLYGGRNYISSSSESSQPAEREPAPASSEQSETKVNRLFRSRFDRKVFGVCGGLGEYFHVDATIVRILFVISAFASFGLTLLLYAIMAIFVPEEPLSSPVS